MGMSFARAIALAAALAASVAAAAAKPDRLLFRFEGMNTRQCVTVIDPVRGKGFRQVSREILIYPDPTTGRIIDEWQNPWSGETVQVLHIANDPVNFRAPIFLLMADGKSIVRAANSTATRSCPPACARRSRRVARFTGSRRRSTTSARTKRAEPTSRSTWRRLGSCDQKWGSCHCRQRPWVGFLRCINDLGCSAPSV